MRDLEVRDDSLRVSALAGSGRAHDDDYVSTRRFAFCLTTWRLAFCRCCRRDTALHQTAFQKGRLDVPPNIVDRIRTVDLVEAHSIIFRQLRENRLSRTVVILQSFAQCFRRVVLALDQLLATVVILHVVRRGLGIGPQTRQTLGFRGSIRAAVATPGWLVDPARAYSVHSSTCG